MPKIYELSQEIIAKIAAGEVIERPAYAIKELIENAIDAQADQITIVIQDSGLKKLQVIDNGEGMDQKDLELSWKPHTTSKITNNDNLLGITSFGFRGEALSSLAAVSKLTLQSRTKNNRVGYQIEIESSKLLSQNPIGMPLGTVIIAENLFANIPARKKFLKSPQTELRHIIDVVNNFVATYPEIHFVLTHNKRALIDAPKTDNLQDRIEKIIGNSLSLFLPIKRDDTYIKTSGFIAKPQLNSTTTSKQFLFVNKRKVTDKLLSLAVKEAFGTMLESNTYPIFMLFLEMPYDLVDVNVHPRKEQVSFINSQTIFQFVKESIIELLQENNITFQNLSWKRSGVGMTNSYAGKLLKDVVLEKEKFTIDINVSPFQLHNLYIVTQTKNSLILIDQHAAHERILFEKLKKEFLDQQKKFVSKKLSKPIPLRLLLSDKTLFEENKKQFEKLGFVIKQQTIISAPELFQDRNLQDFIKELLEEISEGKPLGNIDKTSEEMLAFLACRAAVKSGDKLTVEQMKKIVADLELAPNSVTCPHGRPTTMILALQDIDAFFKR